MSTFFIPELETPFLFSDRPVAVPPDLRPSWRIGIILMLLRICCLKNRSSFKRLHVLNWSVRSAEGQRVLLELVTGIADPESITVRIDPALNQAVDYARAERLVEIVGGDRVELTPLGVNVADDLRDTGGVFADEKEFLAAVGRKVTESLVDRILRPSGGA